MMIEVKPPSTNRGVLNTYRPDLRALIDWVEGTFVHVRDLREIVCLLGMNIEDFHESTGINGYPLSIRFGHIAIYYFPDEDRSVRALTMGKHLVMSGQGCREFETYSNIEWHTFFQSLLENKFKFTRLDPAIDDFKPHFKIGYLKRIIKQGRLRTKFRKSKFISDVDNATGSTLGETIYYGSPSSMVQIRMYEKDKEREANGYVVDEDIKAWNRVEIQLRDERAHEAALIIATNYYLLGDFIVGVLSHYMQFCDIGEDTNKARWKTSKFWLRFLNDAEKIRLSLQAPDASIERSYIWSNKQWPKTLAMLIEAFDGDMQIIYDYVKAGSEKLTDKEKDVIRRFKLKDMNYEDFLEFISDDPSKLSQLRKQAKQKKIDID